MTDLLDALNALTKPTRRKIIQDNPDGPTATKVVEVVDAALLDQLDEAIRSSMGGTTSGGSDPRTRSVMNLAAFELAKGRKGIESQMHGWARIAGSVIDKGSLSVTLENWHVKFIGNPLITRHEVHEGIMRKWAASIVATLDPEKELDFAQNCPACGSDCWYSEAQKASFPRPLVIRYRPADSGVVRDATGLCRACKKVWGARELAYELELAEGAKHIPA